MGNSIQQSESGGGTPSLERLGSTCDAWTNDDGTDPHTMHRCILPEGHAGITHECDCGAFFIKSNPRVDGAADEQVKKEQGT